MPRGDYSGSVTTAEPVIEPAPARRGIPWWVWTVGGLLTVTGVVAAIGGFNDVPVSALPVIELGDTTVGGEASITVDRVYLSDTVPVTGSTANDGEVYIVVMVQTEAPGPQPSLFARNLVRVLVGDLVSANTGPERVVEMRSGASMDFLQPGIPTEIAFAWNVPADAIDVGDEVIVGVFDQFAVFDDPLWGDTSTTGPTPIARIITEIDGHERAPVEVLP